MFIVHIVGKNAKVNGGSPAERAGLQAGDAVIKINSTDIYNLRHKDAQDVIIKAGPSFAITVQRGGSTWKPSVQPTGSLSQGSPGLVTKTSLAAKPQPSIGAIGTGHNVAAKPFLNGTANGGPKLVNKQYNSPIGLYSEQSIAETLSAQSEVLSTGVLGVNFKKNEKNYDATKSAVYHMLQEAENEPRSESEHVDTGLTPAVSNFGLRHVQAPETKPAPSTPQLPPGQNICADCERLIVGVFVRIKDKNLHVECFKCSTCGCSLKNVGYYNINNKLYCDVHAKLAAKSNAPGPNLVPVTLPPGSRAPAGTISAALSSHPLPSPAPLSPKIVGPASPSTNITAAPFLLDKNLPRKAPPDAQLDLNSNYKHEDDIDARLLKSLTIAASRKGSASAVKTPPLPKNTDQNEEFIYEANATKRYDDLAYQIAAASKRSNASLTESAINERNKLKSDDVFVQHAANQTKLSPYRPMPIPYSQFSTKVNKAGYTNAPRPFSSVAAPLSPNSYSKPLPRTPVGPPPSIPTPTSAPVNAPDQVRLVYNIVWPPINDEPELPTACPVYYPPPSQIKLPQRDKLSCDREACITNGVSTREEKEIKQGSYKEEEITQGVFKRDTYISEEIPQGSCEKDAHFSEGCYKRDVHILQDSYKRDAHISQERDAYISEKEEVNTQGSRERDVHNSQGSYKRDAHILQGPYKRDAHITNGTSAREEEEVIQGAYKKDALIREKITQGSYKKGTHSEIISSAHVANAEHLSRVEASNNQLDRDYSEFEDYTNALAAMEHQKMSICSSEVCNLTGRRNLVEVAENLSEALQTQMLVESIIKKRPKSPPPLDVDPIPKSLPKTEEVKQDNFTCPSKEVKPVCALPCDKSCCNQSCPTCPFKQPADLKYPHDYQKAEELRNKVKNAVPHRYETPMVAALKTTPSNPVCISPDIFSYIPSKHSTSALASALSIAPSEPFNPVQSFAKSMEPVPLPEETVPYFPPEHPLPPPEPKPVKKEIEKPESPFVEALKVAPDRPFTPIGKGPTPIRKKPPPDPLLKDLPKPQQRMTMLEALTTTPDRTYSPLIPDIVVPVKKEEEIKAKVEPKKVIKLPQPQPFISTMVNTFEGNPSQVQVQVQVRGDGSSEQELLIHEQGLKQVMYQKQSMEEMHQQQRREEMYQKQSREEVYQKQSTEEMNQQQRREMYQKQSREEMHHQQRREEMYQKEDMRQERLQMEQARKHVTIAEQEVARQSEEVIMKKPMQLTSGLHKSEYLPSYQTSLQYEEEIQLPHHKNINKLLNPKKSSKIVPEPGPLLRPQAHHGNHTPPPANIRPVQIVQSDNPHPHPSVSFQVINDEFHPPSSSMPQRVGTPSASMINKPPSAIPYYQQNLVATEFLAPEINVFDPKSPATSRSPSPCPGGAGGRARSPSPFRPPPRSKSPAQGPPPNPLRKDEVKQSPQFKHELQKEKAKDSVCGYIPHHKEHFEGIMRKEGECYDEQQVSQQEAQQMQQIYNQRAQQEQQMYNQRAQQEQQMYNRQQQQAQHSQQQVQQLYSQQTQQIRNQQAQQEFNQQQQVQAQQMHDQLAQQAYKQEQQVQAYNQQVQAQQTYNQQQQVQAKQTHIQQHQQRMQQQSQQYTQQPTQYVSQCSVQQSQPQYHDQRNVVAQTESRSQVQGQNFQQQNYEATNMRAQESHKHQTSQSMSISEHAKQEQLQKLNKSQTESLETSADSRVQIQRKKFVTEEVERTHKEKTIEIEKSAHPFQKVNAPEVEQPGLMGLHVTNPHPLNSPFLRNQPQGPPPQPVEAKIEKRTVAPCRSQQPNPPPPHPPSKFSVPVPPIVAPPGGQNVKPSVPAPSVGTGSGRQASSVFAPKRGRGVLNVGGMVGNRIPLCGSCHQQIRGPFITALGKIWCPDHFVCNTPSCKRPLQDIGFVEEQGNLHCEYCFERYLAPDCSKCNSKIKGDCLKAIGKNFHPECFNCAYCGKLFGNSPFFLEDGLPYCETDWNEMFTTKCFACGFPVEAGDRWVEALNNNYHSQCFNCTMCKKNLEGQSFFAKGGRPFCKNHAR